jgi:hypothetical protein
MDASSVDFMKSVFNDSVRKSEEVFSLREAVSNARHEREISQLTAQMMELSSKLAAKEGEVEEKTRLVNTLNVEMGEMRAEKAKCIVDYEELEDKCQLVSGLNIQMDDMRRMKVGVFCLVLCGVTDACTYFQGVADAQLRTLQENFNHERRLSMVGLFSAVVLGSVCDLFLRKPRPRWRRRMPRMEYSRSISVRRRRKFSRRMRSWRTRMMS